MTAIHVFDPAMCCSTGICGPSVDPQLVQFAADLDWLKTQGVSVERFNLSQQPGAFAADAAVKATLETKGEAGLPLVKVNGEVRSSGVFPSRDELAAWAGLGVTVSLYTEAVAELVAIGASIAAGCEPCLAFHDDKARKLGVAAGDIARAVGTAQNVKAAKAKLDAARRGDADATAKPKSGGCGSSKAVESTPTAAEKVAEKAGSCCGPATDATKPKSGGCC